MRKPAIAVVAAALAAAAACAPKTVPEPVVTSPKYPDYVAPAVPPTLSSTKAAEYEDRGWRFLQSGDLRAAETEFGAAMTAAPDFFPAEAGLGYTALARKDYKIALSHFDRAVQAQPGYASALVGRGYALSSLDRGDEALAAFEAALAADPSLADIQRRVDVLKFRVAQDRLAGARDAARAGRLDEAEGAYRRAIAASPDSAFLYRELAAVEQQKGDLDAAVEHYRKAMALDSADAQAPERLGDVLMTRSDFDGAVDAYSHAYAIEPGDALERKLDAARDRAAMARMPSEYRAIAGAAQITRADLAALIGVRLAPLVEDGSREAVLITDVGTNWAASWIMSVARAGIMEPYANHAFQPGAIVRRIDFAQAVSRLLARIAARSPARAGAWESARVAFPDLAPAHLAYPAASAAVAAGVMTLGPDGAFQPSQPVSGPEAIAGIARLETLGDVAARRRP
ncbi:MAG: tetratricopeptide repeat protein [Betaproteobacteria bacterium]